MILSILPALNEMMIGACGTFMSTGFDPSPIQLIAMSQTQDIVFFINNP